MERISERKGNDVESAEWEHKEIECIRAWKEGRYPTLELEWSRFNDRK
jgi:hypothetical protein